MVAQPPMPAAPGFPHADGTASGVTMGPDTPAELAFDFCVGGEMWSEENCEYNLWAFLDQNGNGTLDAGEPAGRAVHELSCRATGPACWPVVLDCLDGMSCASFTDPGACPCATPSCEGVGSSSRIVTCT